MKEIMGNGNLYTRETWATAENFTYYISRDGTNWFTLRQTRFIGEAHPHDICAVGTSLSELNRTISGLITSSLLIPDNL